MSVTPSAVAAADGARGGDNLHHASEPMPASEQLTFQQPSAGSNVASLVQ